MKRRYWIGALVMALALAGAMWVLMSRSEFAFLRGHTPIAPPAAERAMYARDKLKVRFYAFRADPKAFTADASAELLRQGFKPAGSKSATFAAAFYEPDEMAFAKSSAVDYARSVVIITDRRYTAKEGVMGLWNADKSKGWVTVGVAERGELSPWKRLLRMVGL